MKCELVQAVGTDLTVVNSARVSFDKESKWAKENKVTGVNELSYEDQKLIKYLAKHNHFTPFTHCTITLREEVPIFVARQRFKHVVGFSYNEISRRYVDDDPKFYFPDTWRKRAENLKQGSCKTAVKSHTLVKKMYKNFMAECESMYKTMLSLNVAPEQARMVLPQSMYTSYYVTGSLSSFARAYKLRVDDHAQLEIQLLAKQWGEICSKLFPVSWEALTGEM
jgi:thymidylate synthase (FAD)